MLIVLIRDTQNVRNARLHINSVLLSLLNKGFMKSMEDNKPYKVYCDDCKKLLYTGIYQRPPPGLIDAHGCSEKTIRLKRELMKGFFK